MTDENDKVEKSTIVPPNVVHNNMKAAFNKNNQPSQNNKLNSQVTNRQPPRRSTGRGR